MLDLSVIRIIRKNGIGQNFFKKLRFHNAGGDILWQDLFTGIKLFVLVIL